MIALGCCFGFYVQNWHILKEINYKGEYGFFLFSLGTATLGMYLLPSSIWILYKGLNPGNTSSEWMAIFKVFRVYQIANIYKYIPGKIPTLMVFIHESSHQKLNLPSIFQAWVAANGLFLLNGVILGLLTFPTYLDNSVGKLFIITLILLLLIFTIHPKTNFLIIGFLFTMLKREFRSVPFQYYNLILSFIVQFLGWIFLGISFAAVSFIFNPFGFDFAKTISSVLIYPAAHSAGFLAFFAPAGVGVREGILLFFLAEVVFSESPNGVSIAMVVVTVHRALMTFIDIGLYFFARKLRGIGN